MAATSEEASEVTSLPASEAEALLSSFTSFLTLSIHSLLYHRALYPQTTFLTARAYNLPVHQSRHPGVCKWVLDAVKAVSVQLQRAAVKRVVFVIHAPDSFSVLERWVFDVSSFPAWQDPSSATDVADDDGFSDDDGEGAGEEDEDDAFLGDEVFEVEGEEDGDEELPDDEVEDEELINWTDVNEALRGALRNLSYVAEKMPPLPNGCRFTLAVDIRKGTPAPVKHPLPWLASAPNLQRQNQKQKKHYKAKGKIAARRTDTMAPIRAVQAGPMFFECWAETSKYRPAASKTPDKPAVKPTTAGSSSESKERPSILKKTDKSVKRVNFKDVPVQRSETKHTGRPTPKASASASTAGLSHRGKSGPPQGKSSSLS